MTRIFITADLHLDLWLAAGRDPLAALDAATWADQVVLEDLGSRTVRDALAAGLPCKRIWRAVWAQLELPATLR